MSIHKHVNIISFDVPFPANYGGVIDVYYKLWYLKQAGVKIHLHCFAYGRAEAPELAALCESVNYYPRKTGWLSNLSWLPYTVKSRQSRDLEKKLLANDYPILFEVLHTCGLMTDKRFAGRRKIYRHSNIEHHYYRALANKERDWLKKIFLKIEAFKLWQFESRIKKADVILAVNQKDCHYFKQKYPRVQNLYLPSFHGNNAPEVQMGKGDYLLFHGNLSIAENYDAAMWLIDHVFSKLHYPVVIAGLNPPDFLRQALSVYQHIQLMANVEEAQMADLVKNAHIHLLYTDQGTGLKLKLLNVLFKGRFVLCNRQMLEGTGLHENHSLQVADTANDFLRIIPRLMSAEISKEHLQQRLAQTSQFDNHKNVETLLGLI